MADGLTAVPDDSRARVVLTLEWAGVDSARIVRNDPDGRTVPVRDAEPLAVPGTVEDIEVPLGAEVSYTATDITPGGASLTSATVQIDARGRVWLKHPGKPDLNLTLVPAAAPERRRELDVSVMPALGRRYPVAVTAGRRRAPEFSLSLRTATLGEASGLRAILDDGSPLLLQGPPEFDLGSEWIQPMALREQWIVRYLPSTRRLWELECVTVDRPAGMSMVSIAGSWRYWQAQYSSWAEMRADYATWREAQDAV
jgi:hypothetical protein